MSFDSDSLPPEQQYLKQFEGMLSKGHKLIEDMTTEIQLLAAASIKSARPTPESQSLTLGKGQEEGEEEAAQKVSSVDDDSVGAAAAPGLNKCGELHSMLNSMNGLMLQVLGTLHVTRKATPTPQTSSLPPNAGHVPGIPDAPPHSGAQHHQRQMSQSSTTSSSAAAAPPNVTAMNAKILSGEMADVGTQVATVSSINYSKKTLEAMKHRRQNEKNRGALSHYKDLSVQLTMDLAKLLHFSGQWNQLMERSITPQKTSAAVTNNNGGGEEEVVDSGGDANANTTTPTKMGQVPEDALGKMHPKSLKAVHTTLMHWLDLHANGKLTNRTADMLDRFAQIQAAPPQSLGSGGADGASHQQQQEQESTGGSWFLCRNCQQDGRDMTYLPKEKQFVPKLPDIGKRSTNRGRQQQPHTARGLLPTNAEALTLIEEDETSYQWLPQQHPSSGAQTARGLATSTSAAGGNLRLSSQNAGSRSFSPPKSRGGGTQTAQSTKEPGEKAGTATIGGGVSPHILPSTAASLKLPKVAQRGPYTPRSPVLMKAREGIIKDRITTIMPKRVKHGFLNQHLPSSGLYHKQHDGSPLKIEDEKKIPELHWGTAKRLR